MITTPEALKEEVSLQLAETVTRLLEFSIGYYKESKKNLDSKSERSSRCLAVTYAKQESYLVVLRS